MCIKQQNVFVVHKCGETKCTVVVRMKFYSIGMQSKQTIFQLFTFPEISKNVFIGTKNTLSFGLYLALAEYIGFDAEIPNFQLLLGKQFNCILSF